MTARSFLFVFLAAAIPAFAEIQVSSTYAYQPDIAWNGSKFGIIYWRAVLGNPLVLVTIDPSGTNPSPEIVSMGINGAQNPVIVAGPGAWAAAWEHPANDGRKIYFAAFDDAGTFRIPPVQVSRTPGSPSDGAGPPWMVWTGSRYYLTWYDIAGIDNEVDTAGIDADGTISIPWQTAVPSGGGWSILAMDRMERGHKHTRPGLGHNHAAHEIHLSRLDALLLGAADRHRGGHLAAAEREP